MRGLSVPRARRRRPAAAAAAYSFALSVLGSPQEAESIACAALRSGARSRTFVLAHARHRVLQVAQDRPGMDLGVLAGSDVRSVAQQLAATRPATERAIVDLELRYGLDNSSFARTLGLSNERALERARAVAVAWSEQLDPAMMAWLGPGSCEALERVLARHGLWPRTTITPRLQDETGPAPAPPGLLATGTDGIGASPEDATIALVEAISVGEILEAAPVVLTHTHECDTCKERMRLLTPVRTLVGQLPPDHVPQAVASAARASHRRLPLAPPPSIEPHRLDPTRIKRALVATVGVVAATGIALAVERAVDKPAESQADRVARLVESASASQLLATPSIMTAETRTASLANNSSETILWHATSSVPWLEMTPSDGRLGPSQSVSVVVEPKEVRPAGPSEGVLTFTGSDGSTQTIRYSVGN